MGPEIEEEDVDKCWVTLREERDDTGNWKRKPCTAVCGDFKGLCGKI
jgi:hypothetical protein